jgi:hypothetical protein
MKKFLFLFTIFGLIGCADDGAKTTGKTENDVDAATTFIRKALDGKWKEARQLVVQDDANIEDLETAERMATRKDAETQRKYRESQINVHDTRKLNDSASVVIYSNTFTNKRDSIKVVKVGGDWLVDLKYSFPNKNPVQQ